MKHGGDEIAVDVQAYFDARARAGTWGALYEPAPQGLHYFNYNFYTRRNAVIGLIGTEPAERILDVGCGTGDYAVLARLAPYCGIDFAPEMVRQARQRDLAGDGRIAFAAASGEHIPYRDASFDLVLAIGYIEYLDDPCPSLAEFRRVLRPGGRLVLQSFKPELFGTVARIVRAPARAVYRRLVPRRGGAGVRHRPYTPRQLDGLVARFGFARTDFVFNNFYVMPQVLRLAFPGLYIRLSETLTRANPRGWSPLAINYIGKYVLSRA